MRSVPLWGKLLGGIGVIAAICVGLAFVPTGEVAYAPNAPIDLDGKISVEGRPAQPLQGSLYLVGVTERKVNLLQRLLLDVADPSVDFGPAPKDAPSGGGPSATDVRSMDEAKQVAAGIAFDLAGQPTHWSGSGATVETVAKDGPAAKLLKPGDIIVSVNGTAIDTSVEAARIIQAAKPGTVVQLGVQRAGTPMRIAVRTVSPLSGDTTHASEIGVALSTIGLKVGLPRNVTIDSGNVVGPSAALAFALYLVDSLSDEDLLRGRRVVATGALAPDGTVLSVGRVRQKAIATQSANRDLLLVPAANAKEARAAITKACDTACVTVVPVRSVAEAVALLELDDATLASRTSAS